jgi:hypothetical protein
MSAPRLAPDRALRAEADACERLADAFARKACALAGRAAFRRRAGDLAAAAALEGRLAGMERREATVLELARSCRRLAARLEARRREALDLVAIAGRPPTLH